MNVKQLLIAVVALALAFAALATCCASSGGDEWEPYTPDPSQVEVSWTCDSTVELTIKITFPHAGFLVLWGPIVVDEGTVIIHSVVNMWRGPAAQVVTVKSHSWSLPPGNYELKFYVNGELVKTATISCSGASASGASPQGLDVVFLSSTVIALAILLALIVKFLVL
ncbi:MAG: hypothetical protein DRJ62_06295 [Thermoprotei archaeon]|nr:MAG: hypothetical protein DRJ62_06295 [Thermoprotei archaeon]